MKHMVLSEVMSLDGSKENAVDRISSEINCHGDELSIYFR